MATPARVGTVAVIGNGIIGHGVAQIFAVGGRDVRLIGRSRPSLDRAMDRIRESLDRFVAHGLLPGGETGAALRRITPSPVLDDAGGADLVIEAVTEDLALKHAIFERLDRVCPPPAVLASSSGQPASRLVARVAHRARVAAAHFWNPPQLVPLVEVCGGPETAPDVVPWLCDVLRAVGKQPVILDREIDGFIGNRLQFALLREALALWASGVASAEAIDRAVTASFGRRLAVTGPLESADVGGLDTMHAFAAFLFPSLDTSAEPPAAMGDLVRQGHRGLPSGRGLYDWSRRDGRALVAERVEELFRHLKRMA
ncbi:MAG: 3-hydroxyacyl-CoA dehydrogenase family protein [Candidatus Rokubacteria bacterium]|nr:3-hydroxyacyl-CoA dehydrogenase family protein [Candidatus Rokubacteria bacterium]